MDGLGIQADFVVAEVKARCVHPMSGGYGNPRNAKGAAHSDFPTAHLQLEGR